MASKMAVITLEWILLPYYQSHAECSDDYPEVLGVREFTGAVEINVTWPGHLELQHGAQDGCRNSEKLYIFVITLEYYFLLLVIPLRVCLTPHGEVSESRQVIIGM